MKSGSKKALTAVLVLLVVIASGAIYLLTQLDSLVAGQIEKHGSAATQTDVRVSGVNIDLQAASAGLSGLTVANPEGFGGNAIELGQFTVAIDPASVTTDTIVLPSVTVSSAHLNLVQQGAGSNLKTILDNLRGDAPRDTAADDGAAGKKIVIERFILDDARASVSLPDLDENREVTVPRIELTGIGRDSNGATAAQAARQILEPVIERTLRSAAAQAVKDRAKEKLDEARDNLLDGVMDRLGGKDEDETDQQQNP